LANSPDRYRAAYLKILEKVAMITMPGVAFMIAMSNWLVLFLLGSQWQESGRIFMLLGIAAIIQPVARTALWLFTTQGRSREIFKWGVMSAAIETVVVGFGLAGRVFHAPFVSAVPGLHLNGIVQRKGDEAQEQMQRHLSDVQRYIYQHAFPGAGTPL